MGDWDSLADDLVALQLGRFNRIYTLGTIGGLLVLELVFAAIHFRHVRARMKKEATGVRVHMRNPNVFLLALMDLALYLALFYMVFYWKYDTTRLPLETWELLMIMIGMWVFSGKWTGKLEKRELYSFFHAYEPFYKAGFILMAAAALLMYSFQIYQFSRTILFAPVLALVVAEAPLAWFWYCSQGTTSGRASSDIEKAAEVKRAIQEIRERPPVHAAASSSRNRLKSDYLADFPALFKLIDKHCKLDQVPQHNLAVLDTHTSYNVRVLEESSLALFINLHRVNDFRWLNSYFLQVHAKLSDGGYFIGMMDTVESVMERLEQRYPKYMAYLLYSCAFCYRRVMPKVPGLDKIYFFLSGGRNRLFSKAELLGRLYFCGFRVLTIDLTGHQLYFIAQKSRQPNSTHDPSFGMLIRLKRIGFQGKPIYLYKLRTMHPYSEFLQEYIYLNHSLDDGGKFKDDFRVAAWGKLLRALWLDEMPQLINWLRGDVKLVGARALSEHYFSLYPDDLQELRNQYKPGLLPPYYADMPRTLQQVQDSERRYFLAKQAHPVWTDWNYFFRASFNILFKNARSK